MVYKWKREQIEKLIACIKENPCIYDVKSVDYMDRTKKAQVFNSILEEMQQLESTITLDEIKRKWKNLRTQYTQELRMMSLSKKSLPERSEVCVSKLWCFDQLDFLKTHTVMRISKDNIEVITPDRKPNISNFYEEDPLGEEPPKKRHKGQDAINAFRSDLDNFKNILTQRKAERKFDWLGILVANQMDEINPEEQADAAWQVQCLMWRLTNNYRRKRESFPA